MNVVTLNNAIAQTRDTLIIERVSIPENLSGMIKKSDIIIEKKTYQLLLGELDNYDNFKSSFDSLYRENDSLYQIVQQQLRNIENIYSQTQRLENKLLNQQIELIRSEEELKKYQASFQSFQDQVNALKPDKVEVRTRYIFRTKPERRWFYITLGVFIAVPTIILSIY